MAVEREVSNGIWNTEYIIDSEDTCNISRFVAHSCDPNCSVESIPLGPKVSIKLYQ
jgi:SET domain-containing protein